MPWQPSGQSPGDDSERSVRPGSTRLSNPRCPRCGCECWAKRISASGASIPELSPIFALGSRVTWVSPSGTALIVDKQGQDKPSDAVLSRLFERPKARMPAPWMRNAHLGEPAVQPMQCRLLIFLVRSRLLEVFVEPINQERTSLSIPSQPWPPFFLTTSLAGTPALWSFFTNVSDC